MIAQFPETLAFGNLALRFGLVLLGLAFALEIIVAGDGADGLLGLALHVFDDALDAFLAIVARNAVLSGSFAAFASLLRRICTRYPMCCFPFLGP